MKVKDINYIQEINKLRRKKNTNLSNDVSFDNLLDGSNSIETPAEIFQAQSPYLALQELSNNEDAYKKANNMIKSLEDIRLNFLIEDLSVDKILELKLSLEKDQEANLYDPKISAILKEIEMRLEIELAKLEKLKS